MQLSPAAFEDLRRVIPEFCGIVLSADKQYLVKSRLEPVLRRNRLASYEALVAALAGGGAPALRDEVIEAITTKETSFNRDGHPFDELRRSILPELAEELRRRRGLTGLTRPRARIWCAAAATGQEVYSVAMAVADVVAARPALGLSLDDFPITATDISAAALAAARLGRYTEAEVSRGVTADQRVRYFRPDGNGWMVVEPLRRMVEYRRLNLAQPPPGLGPFDLILCRNLMIYFDEPTRRRVCQALYQSLNPRGLLLIGAAESLYGLTDAFVTERMGQTIVHRRAPGPAMLPPPPG
ncbi:MAG: protein-glutamate O-methyltransferase CheR [Thermoleophilia bacterium]|nr:protein-glutamate O-methyltransferase CheR [Thermoleophilia bacterium]